MNIGPSSESSKAKIGAVVAARGLVGDGLRDATEIALEIQFVQGELLEEAHRTASVSLPLRLDAHSNTASNRAYINSLGISEPRVLVAVQIPQVALLRGELMSVPLHQERVISFYKFPDEFSGHYGAGQDVHFQPRIQRKRKVHKTQMCIGRGQAGGGEEKKKGQGLAVPENFRGGVGLSGKVCLLIGIEPPRSLSPSLVQQQKQQHNKQNGTERIPGLE